jgi:hypothetical protein
MIDLDIRKFFDSVRWDLIVKAVEAHTDLPWVVLYVKRWLAAPLQLPDGSLLERDRGTAQGSSVSPVLANLFMHYAFDTWLARNYPGVQFERYADDAVVHCATERQAREVLAAIGKRVLHAGEVGAGHAVKALNNLMSAAHLIVSSEALIAGQRFGLDPAVMLEIINGSSGRSGSTENKWPNYVLTEKFDAGFSIRLMVKDMRLALGIEHATGTPSLVSDAVLVAWESALSELPGDADHTEIARWLDRG